MTAYERLVRSGFAARPARELADAGFDVIGVLPLGWAALPIDEHLARISLFFDSQACNSRPVIPGGAS
jgi:hypothetical protein